MNVYLTKPDGSDGRWVWFYTKEDQEHKPLTGNQNVISAYYARNPLIRIRRNYEQKQKIRLELADCSSLGYGDLVLSARAKECLGPHIDHLGQWVKLEFDEAPYWLFRLTHEVDALDEAASKLILFRDGNLMEVETFAFRPEAIKDQLFFTIKQQSGRYLLCIDALMDLVRKHQLTGFKFIPVWSSNTGSTMPNHNDPNVWRTGLEPLTSSERAV